MMRLEVMRQLTLCWPEGDHVRVHCVNVAYAQLLGNSCWTAVFVKLLLESSYLKAAAVSCCWNRLLWTGCWEVGSKYWGEGVGKRLPGAPDAEQLLRTNCWGQLLGSKSRYMESSPDSQPSGLDVSF